MNKKLSFILSLFASFLMFALLNTNTAEAAKTCSDGKVVIHYKTLDGVYDTAGVWTWDNGTNGSNDGIAKTSTDSFGAVVELCVGSDAGNTGYFIPIKANLASDTTTWPGDDNKNSFNGQNISYDRTTLQNNTVEELHVYFIAGLDGVFYSNNPVYNKAGFGTITVVYFDVESINDVNAYNGWNIWSWNTGTGGSLDAVEFTQQFVNAEGYTLKIATIFIGADQTNGDLAGSGFIVRTNDWAKKYSSDLFLDPEGVRGSGDKLAFYVAGKDHITYSYSEFKTEIESVITNSYVPFDPATFDAENNTGTGTFADTLSTIHVEMKFEVEVDGVEDLFALKNAKGNVINIKSIEALDEADGVAFKFKITTQNDMSKAGEYTLTYNNGEATTLVNLDNNAPLIDYTNKVKTDPTKFDDKSGRFIVQKGEKFKFADFVRLNVVDDRDGSLLGNDELLDISGKVNERRAGVYTIKVTATDSWNNVSVKEFKFEVVNNGLVSTPLVIGGAVLVLALIGVGGAVIYKRKNS